MDALAKSSALTNNASAVHPNASLEEKPHMGSAGHVTSQAVNQLL